MKKRLLIALAIMLSVHHAKSQFVSWEKTGSSFLYDFSGARGVTSTELLGTSFTANHVDTSNTAKPGWLPAPTSGSAYMRLAQGTAALPQNAKFDLDLISNPKNLKVRIPAGGITSFSVADVANASEVVRFSATVNFGSVTAVNDKALMRIGIGNFPGGTSSTFTTGSNIGSSVDANVFAALGFEYNATTNKVTLKVRRNQPSANYTDIKTSYFEVNTNYLIEIIGNNSSVVQKYNYGTTTDIELASRTFHIYANGIKIDNSGNFTFPDAAAAGSTPELAVDKTINAVRVWFVTGNTDIAKNPTFTTSNMRFDYATSTLPVSLTSFTAQKQNNSVKLDWATASEQRNSHFDVLRSSDGKDFHSIVQVAGAGNSTEMRQYSHTDYNPFSGTNYYKLKQVDFDGTATESDVRAVTVSLEKDEFIIYQEGNRLTVSVYSGMAESGTLRVSDISGKVLIEKEVTLQAGYTKVSLDNKILTPGVYVAHIIASGKSKSIKFLHGQ